MIQYTRRVLYWAVIESDGGLKGGTRFEMKYSPDLDKMTKRENAINHTASVRIIEAIFFMSAGVTLCIAIALGYYLEVVLLAIGVHL
jgi:hypothetical protein